MNLANNDRWTPLHFAATYGRTDIAQALITAGADVNAKDEFGYTPLHLAARDGQVEIAQALITAGADVNAQNNSGYTRFIGPLIMVTQR